MMPKSAAGSCYRVNKHAVRAISRTYPCGPRPHLTSCSGLLIGRLLSGCSRHPRRRSTAAVCVRRVLRSRGRGSKPWRQGQSVTRYAGRLLITITPSERPTRPRRTTSVQPTVGIALSESPRGTPSVAYSATGGLSWTAGGDGEAGQGAEHTGGGALKYRDRVQFD